MDSSNAPAEPHCLLFEEPPPAGSPSEQPAAEDEIAPTSLMIEQEYARRYGLGNSPLRVMYE